MYIITNTLYIALRKIMQYKNDIHTSTTKYNIILYYTHISCKCYFFFTLSYLHQGRYH